MKGKLFVLFIMVGVPIMMLSTVAWDIMLVLGALHSALRLIPAPSFGISLIVTMLIFSIVTYKLISTAASTAPSRRHRL